MSPLSSPGPATAHRLRPMSGRDPHEEHRQVTTLGLLYDLTFVVAFGQAASQFAHLLVLMLAPLVTVVGYETTGHRHMAIAVQRTLAG